MIQQINPEEVRQYFNTPLTLRDLRKKTPSQLKVMHNEAWDFCSYEGVPLGDIKRRRKWESEEEAIQATWKILGIMNGDITMPDEKTTDPKPTPKCYSAEVVKRPSRKMFMRIKKVGEPDKSQRPFAWPQFKDGMRLVDIKEDPNLHAGKISFWMRQEPPLIKLEDIDDETYAKERAAWYKKHGLTDPDLEKEQKKADREKAKAEREKERAAKAEERAKKKAEADAKKKADAEAKAKAKADKEAAKKTAAAGEKKKAGAA